MYRIYLRFEWLAFYFNLEDNLSFNYITISTTVTDRMGILVTVVHSVTIKIHCKSYLLCFVISFRQLVSLTFFIIWSMWKLGCYGLLTMVHGGGWGIYEIRFGVLEDGWGHFSPYDYFYFIITEDHLLSSIPIQIGQLRTVGLDWWWFWCM